MQHPLNTVYVLYSLKDHPYYIGYTTDFERRMEERELGRIGKKTINSDKKSETNCGLGLAITTTK